MPFFENNTVRLHYRERGAGFPLIFQHGLGASVTQPFELFKPPPGIRLIGFDARGHGLSGLGPPNSIGLGTSADDLLALMTCLGIETAIVGGISMGAAIALNFALRYPARVSGLVLSRPAWLAGPNWFNVRIFALVAEFIESHGPEAGAREFQQTQEYRDLRDKYPDTAKSLVTQFQSTRARDTAINLRRIPPDSPIQNMSELAGVSVPTLILSNQQDPIHPFEYGVALAQAIPGAEFYEIASKSVDIDRHIRETGRFLAQFLTDNFLHQTPPI